MNFEAKFKNDLTRQGVDVTPTTVVHDLFLRKFVELHGPFEEEFMSMLERMDFTNFGKLTAEDLIKFAGNFFVSRKEGVRASNYLRLFYPLPADITVPKGTVFFDEGNTRRYVVEDEQSITSDQMVTNIDGIYYYFDVWVVAEEPGSSHNADIGEITQCNNVVISSQVTKIENVVAFTNGKDPEGARELFDRTKESITVLNLANNKSINKVIRDQFADVTKIYVVRAKHAEMYRDRILVDINGAPTEVRVGNMVDVYVDSLQTRVLRTVVYNHGQDDIPFGYGALDFQDNPIPNTVFRVLAVRISDANGEVTGDELSPSGWTYTQKEHHENSTQQEGVLTITDPDYTGSSQYFEIEYYGSPYLPHIQALVESNEERMPVGDYLIKGFFLSFLSGVIQYVGATPAEEMQRVVDDYLSGYSAPELEVSDVVDLLYQHGATKVVLPITLSISRQDGSAEEFQDAYTFGSKETFIARDIVVVKVG